MEYLNEKNKSKEDIRLKELALEEQRLNLEREKLEFEKEKFQCEKEENTRKAKIEEEKNKMEILERRAILNVIESQQSVLSALLEKI